MLRHTTVNADVLLLSFWSIKNYVRNQPRRATKNTKRPLFSLHKMSDKILVALVECLQAQWK